MAPVGAIFTGREDEAIYYQNHSYLRKPNKRQKLISFVKRETAA